MDKRDGAKQSDDLETDEQPTAGKLPQRLVERSPIKKSLHAFVRAGITVAKERILKCYRFQNVTWRWQFH